MKEEILVPSVGESVSSGILAAWLKETGDYVKEGEEIFELETDKATLAVPSTASGLLKPLVEEGSEVEVGQKVAEVDTEAKAGPEETRTAGEKKGAGESREAARERAASKDAPPLSPAVRRIVEEYNLDPNSIKGSGKDGLITKEDALSAAGPDVEELTEQKPDTVQAEKTAGKEAPEKGTSEKDVSEKGAARPSTGRTDVGAEENTERVKMSSIRKRIAENLVLSQQNAAHLTTFNEIDMSEVIAIRKRYREEFEKRHGVRLGFMSFFVKASVAALSEYPEANAYIEGDEIVYHHFYNIGIAMASEKGLITPVIRGAEQKSFAEVEADIIGFAGKAKNKRIMPDDLSGGTFTITNGGVFGSLLSTPIPNPPQSAILGMHSINERPVAIEGEVVVRPMMYVALTYDHRIIDGKEAIGFLMKIKKLIEDPNQILLEL